MQPTIASKKDPTIFDHSYYQGLLVEIGKKQAYKTYIPPQDKNKPFLGKQKLGAIADLTEIFRFTYDQIVKRAKTIDVIWFNQRHLPNSLFEVEYSTDIKNSLLKFVELQDFKTKMIVVADKCRFKAYQSAIAMTSFKDIRDNVVFWNYEQVADYHAQIHRMKQLESSMGLA